MVSPESTYIHTSISILRNTFVSVIKVKEIEATSLRERKWVYVRRVGRKKGMEEMM